MSFEASDSDEVMNEINMTPLVDVMLVLLVIFMITMPVVHHAVKVALPQASSQRHQPPTENLQLVVNSQGQYFLGHRAVPADALEDTLGAHASKVPQPALYIRGDKTVAYDHVAQAMSAAQRAGLGTLAFVTESK